MRERFARIGRWALATLVVTLALAPLAAAQDQRPAKPDDILKNITVAASGKAGGRVLPKIGIQPSLASNIEDVTVHNVVARDLDLCGEFEVLPDSAAPDGLYLSGTPVDVDAWKKKGAEAVVKISGKKLASGRVELKGVAYLVDEGTAPVYEKKFEIDATQTRVESHRIADALIGALTGTNGGFSSEMTFVYAQGKARRVYVIDGDGHDPRPVSPLNHVALSPTFGPGHKLYWTASINKGRYQIYTAGSSAPRSLKLRGSVYGLAWSRKHNKVAASIGVGSSIKLFRGPDLDHLSAVSGLDMAMHPAWSPNDRLAAASTAKWGPRIFVDQKPISPSGLNASAPVFCRHPNGVRAIYAVSAGKNTDLVASGERGGGLLRLTQGRGRNSFPACSPDGRLVAFFSTRTSGKGPGLYIMRVDGTRPKRISTLVGDSLRWARLPAGRRTPVPTHK